MTAIAIAATDFAPRSSGSTKSPSFQPTPRAASKPESRTDEQSIDYELSFDGLQGIVAQSHIHVAQKDVNGVIVLWLCQGTSRAPANVAALTPECPQEGTVSGTLTAANVVQPVTPPPPPQQILAGELDEVITAIWAGKAYSTFTPDLSPGGEIRGQLDVDDDHSGHKRKVAADLEASSAMARWSMQPIVVSVASAASPENILHFNFGRAVLKLNSFSLLRKPKVKINLVVPAV